MRKQLFLAIQTRLGAMIETIACIDLWKNQDQRIDAGQLEPYPYPSVFIEFIGGEWTRATATERRSKVYVVCLHVWQENLLASHTGAAAQEDGLEHLNYIDQVINAIDLWAAPGVSYSPTSFSREELDREQTNLIAHKLYFNFSVAMEIIPPNAQPSQTWDNTSHNVKLD